MTSTSTVFQPTIQALYRMDHVIKDDKRWYQDWPLRILHHQVIALKLPYLICVGLYAGKRVAEKENIKIYIKVPVIREANSLSSADFWSAVNFCQTTDL